MLQWILSQLPALDKKAVYRIELACEEALVNIIHHSKALNIDIEVAFTPKSHIEILIKDRGPPFDPTEHEVTLDPNKIGGLGIHFIRKYMDAVRYQREGNVNT
jgi:serine/threonine-protein kinase RsbW